jgi:hypothetical protein
MVNASPSELEANMKLQGYERTTRNVSIDVNPMDAVAQLKALVFNEHKLPTDVYIDSKGQLVIDTEYHTSHSWFETTVAVSKPTKQQLGIIKLFNELYELVQKAAASEDEES